MTDAARVLAELDDATAEYRAAKAALEHARERVVGKVAAALRTPDVGPTEVARHSPFTEAHIRSIRRSHDIPPASPGVKKRKS